MSRTVPENDVEQMKRWMELVDDYNESELGVRSPYKAVSIKAGPAGQLLLVLEPKAED